MIKRKDMMSDVTDYLIKNLKKGYTKESLKWALVNQGYSKIEVVKAMQRAEEQMASEAPILKMREIEQKVKPVEEEVKRGFWSRLFG